MTDHFRSPPGVRRLRRVPHWWLQRVRQVAFWTAIVLPVVYTLVLFGLVPFELDPVELLGLFAANFLMLGVGHDYAL